MITNAEQRRFDRASWLTLAFVLGFAVFCTVVSALVMRLPSDGCVMSDYSDGAPMPQIVDSCYGTWPTPLHHGDKVLAFGPVPISNDPTAPWGGQTPPPAWDFGATIEYMVQRGDTTIVLPVPIGQLGWGGVARVFGYTLGFGPDGAVKWLSEYLLYLSAVIIFALAPRSGAARLLLVSFGAHFAGTRLGWAGAPVSSAFSFAQGPFYYASYLVSSFWVLTFWPSLLLLVLSFPRRVWPVARWPRATPALCYGVPALVVLLTPALGSWVLFLIVLLAQFLLLAVALIAVTAHTFARVRDRVVRAQTGWLLLGLACYIAPVVIGYSLILFAPQAANQIDQSVPILLLDIVTGIGTPLCFGIAITRYRLFDIELVIRRTLVYSVLTLTLGAAYLVGVVALQALFVRLTGQESALAVVASTLAIAALFGPLRRGVQRVIDRRFFRRKYDAQQVLERFALRVQQQADLDALASNMLHVVQETLEPEGAQLWLVR
ncbi:MAG: hypothetical protein H7Z42_03110 [Roseiflexaceae bacterium]|nr:hypothetical protein [Roseiflexaceae bacterium]